MNKPIKIFLLVAAVLLGISGVMAYYKTIVSPPGKLTFKNQYANTAKSDIARMKSLDTDFARDSAFFAITHKLDWLLANSLLSPAERDNLTEAFATQYIPTYVSACNQKFDSSVWNEDELTKMDARVSELKSLQATNGSPIVKDEANASLSGIHDVIANYYEAKGASFVNGYDGLASAKQKIAEARRYAAMSPINNCSDLLSRLKSVPARLEQAHYAYLADQVECLRYYYNYSQIEYANLAVGIWNELQEYRDQAKGVYGQVSDLDELNGRAAEYYRNARFN